MKSTFLYKKVDATPRREHISVRRSLGTTLPLEEYRSYYGFLLDSQCGLLNPFERKNLGERDGWS